MKFILLFALVGTGNAYVLGEPIYVSTTSINRFWDFESKETKRTCMVFFNPSSEYRYYKGSCEQLAKELNK